MRHTNTSGLRVPVGVHGSGLSLPGTVVRNADLVRTLDTSDEWITTRTGIRERRFLEEGRTTSDLCAEAAREALRRSGVEPSEVDAVVLATLTPDQPLPSTALTVATEIGADRAIPVDLNQLACAGGVLGLLFGAHLLQNERLRYALVIGADVMSRLTDPRERTTRVFFGDAAGAVVLGRVPDGYGIVSWDTGAALSHAVEVPAGGAARPHTPRTVEQRQQYLRMDGRAVWQEALKAWPGSIARAVAEAGLDLDDIDRVALHQPNLNLIAAVAESLGLDMAKVGVTVDRLGNTSAATVFTVLHEMLVRGELRRGSYAVLSGIGAGLIWGSLVLRQY